MTNWKVYWGALLASLFAVSLWRNNRKYQERSRWFRLGKAFMAPDQPPSMPNRATLHSGTDYEANL
jgi:hypothetical protein